MMPHKDPKKRKAYLREWREKNATKVREGGRLRARKYNKTDKGRKKNREASRAARTGISEHLFNSLMLVQGGRCAVCETHLDASNAQRDHCHTAQEPRGLLCRACNHAEGNIKQSGLSPSVFADRLQRYLDNPPARIAKLI